MSRTQIIAAIAVCLFVARVAIVMGLVHLPSHGVAPTPRPVPALSPVAGFHGGAAPAVGVWHAHLEVTSSRGFADSAKDRIWAIGGQCLDTRCGETRYTLTRYVPGDTPDTAALRKVSGGWRAEFFTEASCGRHNGSWVSWPLQMHVVLRFNRLGDRLIGAESEYAESDQCGYGSATRDWQGTYAGPTTPSGDPPAPGSLPATPPAAPGLAAGVHRS